MSSRSSVRRATAAAIAAGLTAATLVTAAPAQAGSGSSTYTCTFPVVGAQQIPVATTIPDLPALPAGASVPAGSLDPAFVFDVTSIAGVIGMVAGPSATGMGLGLDGGTVPLQGFSFGSLSGTSLPATAQSAPFQAPSAPGDYPITMPTSFDLVGTFGGAPLTVPCATALPAVLGVLSVLGDGPVLIPSTTEASVAKKRIARGKKATVRVSVEQGTDPLVQPATGDVVVRKGKRAVGRGTLEAGEATIKTTRFKKPGRYRLTVKYLGNELTEPSTDTVVVRVKRRR